ncbi:hypothetical protein ACQP25_16865 [Microtetraspora malaysiensis]|uniref:hypothetical protein n=1 Tax=Microtetraspora malaysiensis TaxID=161358 RepID=UPI003D940079
MDAFTTSSAKAGVFGRNDGTVAPPPGSPGGAGVFGLTVVPDAAGVFGANNNLASGRGVQGNGAEAGVSGFSDNGNGVLAHSNHSDAIRGFAHDASANGILGHNSGTGVAPAGGPPAGCGVFGFSAVSNGSGVWGGVDGGNTEGAGVTGSGPTAGRFFGDVEVKGTASFDSDVKVSGDISLIGADLAEHFEIVGSDDTGPGTVMVLDGVDRVRISDRPYDRRVAGVVSGAGEYRPGVIMGHRGPATGSALALLGKVYCKVDASFAPVETGDLLTTSPTPGHAMKVTDPAEAFGAVIGKAMAPLNHGCDLIPILIALQ